MNVEKLINNVGENPETTAIKHYYGYIPSEGAEIQACYGFVEEGNPIIDDTFIEISEEYLLQLLDEQGAGKEIVSYNGRVFTAEVGEYYVEEVGKWKKRSAKSLEKLKLKELQDKKLEELNKKLTDKQKDTEATVTINLPVTLSNQDSTKQVESFKLLTVTSAGELTTLLTGYVVMANTMDIPDLLVTADGYTIVGLNSEVNGSKLINHIFGAYSLVVANITTYFRTLKEKIVSSSSIEELETLEIDFDKF